MPFCVFLNCKTYTGTALKNRKDISFHLFPKDGLVTEKWIQVVRTQRREDEWMPTTYSAICSQHFVESDKYITKNNVHKVIKTAVPVIKQKENLSKGIISDESSKNENISDHDSLDTRTKAYLKKKMIKIIQSKRKLQMKNYHLTRQNKRLKEKCDKLEKVVSKLKKIFCSRKKNGDDNEKSF